MKIGVNLTGGGSRGAYQAGVLLALSELLQKHHLTAERNPLKLWSGVSAGSINQAYCVAGIENFSESSFRLAEIWSNLRANRIYRTDLLSVGKNSVRWIRDLSLGSLASQKSAKSLLDTRPLYELLSSGVFYDDIQKNINKGLVDGMACSAFSYRDNRTVTFVQAREDVRWDKPKRYSVKAQIGPQHVLASCAIPILFPAVPIQGEYFGDGSFRCTTPISPILHLGAKKVLMIGVRGPSEVFSKPDDNEPGIARIAGHILNALFFDSIDIDLERIQHLNELVEAVHEDEVKTRRSEYAKVEVKLIRPSQDLAKIANEKARSSLPRTVDFLLSGLGSEEETAELASYILFEKAFTKELVELGYQDFQTHSDSVAEWMLT